MQIPHLSDTEQERLAILKSYDVLDTLPEKLYDNITLLASQICGTPVALVSLVDETRQWFKSKIGTDVTETPREISFCAHAILEKGVFEVKDATSDPRFAGNPLVTGAPKVVFYAGAPLRTPTGQQIGTLCVLDHSPRALKPEQTSSLEALADQVVALLELRLSARAANAASISKSQFLANMSHEIRTPLGAILGFTEILKDPELPREDREKYLGIIARNGKSLSDLIDDILDLSKVEANQMLIDVQPCKIQELVASVEELFQTAAEAKQLNFSIEISPEVPAALMIDPARTRQILVNVIGNAIKFTSRGFVKTVITYTQKQLLFTVSDSGKGIAPEQTRKLFRPFVQADKSVTRDFGGTGLGLHLTRKLCELFGGTFALQSSELGVGSVFVASIKADLPAASLAPQNTPKRAAAQLPTHLHTAKLLIVDDSIDNRVLLNILLKSTGAEIAFANDGKEGVSIALNGNFDAIFMDIQMPVMDGHEATKTLREKGWKKPIIALTAHAMKEERQRTIESGFTDYLSKPIIRSELARVLATIQPAN